ncbi:MAG: FAD-binding oxidoreductase [Deltaproteobacteria bacterium]|nr:MAG: FAD-binding oxidoreductase [Deltaproteobacteria bacterium]
MATQQGAPSVPFLPDAIANELRLRLSPSARVRVDDAARLLYSRDCWPWLLIHTRAGRHSLRPPHAVVQPATIEDVQETIRMAAAHGLPVVPYGAGSGVTGAAVPTRGGLTVDLKRLTSLDLSLAGDGIARLGAGWVGGRLEHVLNRRGLTLGHFPSSIGCSTLGGWIATRSAGQLSTRHGKIEDRVLATRLVDANGDLRHVPTPHTDALPILVGSEGTLGVLVDADVVIEPLPRARRYRGFLARTVDEALDAMREVLQQGQRPAVLRLYDAFDTFISSARRATAGAAPSSDGLTRRLRAWIDRRVSVSEARRFALNAGAGLLRRTDMAPIALNRAADTLFDGCLLIAGVEEADDEHADASAADLFGLLGDRLDDLGTAPGDHWYAHRYDVSYKQSPAYDSGIFVDTMEVAASWDRLPHLHAAVRSALGDHVFVMAHFSHAYAAGCSIYFTFAGFGRDDDECLTIYARAWNAALAAAARSGGAVTHHHGVGLLKAAHLIDDHTGGGALFDRVKHAVDPDDRLNPGKLWHAPPFDEVRP